MDERERKDGLRIVKGEAPGEMENDKGGEEEFEETDLSGGAAFKLEVQVPLVALDGDFESALARLGELENGIEEWREYLRLGDAAAWVLYGRLHAEVEVLYAALCEFLDRRADDEGEDDDGSGGGGGEVGG